MAAPTRHRRRADRSRVPIALALTLALGASLAATVPGTAATTRVPAAGPSVAVSALAPWTGGVNLYRKGVFTTQKSWLWCTAAGIQIVRNIVRGTRDHTAKSQRHYFNWMRKRNRYSLPLSAGVDAQGWAAGMRHFVDARYRLIASKTFDSALRLAVIRLRKTNLPVGVTVSRGNHAWILTGFTATADPAATRDFKVTSVRVTGPLYGLQSRNGYDMKPNKKLTVAQFRRFFTPWRYAPKRMIWDGRFVSVQPVTPRKAASTAAPAQIAGQPSDAAAAPVGAAVLVLGRQPVGSSLIAVMPGRATLIRLRRHRRRPPRPDRV